MQRGLHMRGVTAIGMGDIWSNWRDKVFGEGSKADIQKMAITAVGTAVQQNLINKGTVHKETMPATGGVMVSGAPAQPQNMIGTVTGWVKENPLPTAAIVLALAFAVSAFRK